MRAVSAVIAFAEGASMNVSEVCRENGIATKTFYKYVARYRDESMLAFEPRSTRPLTCPNKTSPEVEDAIVALRKELGDAGHDNGAATIWWHLKQDQRFIGAVPVEATVYRVLVRRGFVCPQPRKRPKNSWHRFEASAPNEIWQIDHTDWATSAGIAKIFNIVDDHSRAACRSRAVAEATSVEAWITFCQAAAIWGFPAGALSDNGLCFSGKCRGFEVLFETHLRDSGIRPITGRIYHPQTTGKVERFQQTLKKHLRHLDRQLGLAADLDALQQRLDAFCDYYNTQRPHQGIGRVTPRSRWQASQPARPGDPIPHPTPQPETHTLIVDGRGNINMHRHSINVGMTWTGCAVTVILDEHTATILSGNELVRHLRLDPDRYYQPSGRPRGGPRQPRRLSS